MEGSDRDSTQDWLLPEGSAPPLVSELEWRIDEAIAVARVSEARSEATESAVVAVGEAALDAAEQARRAAGVAERAAASAVDAQRRVEHVEAREQSEAREHVEAREHSKPRPSPGPDLADESLRGFSERADRIMLRLRNLEHRPARAGTMANGQSTR